MNERPIRPKPLIPTRTVIRVPPPIRCCSRANYSRAASAFANLRGIVGQCRSGAATSARPARRRTPGSRRRRPASAPSSSVRKHVDPGAVVEHGPQMVGAVEARGLGDLRARGCRPARPAPRCAATASRIPGTHEHRQQARVERAGREHDLVGGARSPRPRRAARRRRRARARPAGSVPAVHHRDLPSTSCRSTAARRRRRRAFSTTGSVVAGQHPADARRAARPASSRAAPKSPSVSASPTSTRLPSACPSSSPPPKRCSNASAQTFPALGQRDQALAEVAGWRRHRGRDAADRDEPPSSATLTTAVMRPRVPPRRTQRDREAVPAAERDDRRAACRRRTCQPRSRSR